VLPVLRVLRVLEVLRVTGVLLRGRWSCGGRTREQRPCTAHPAVGGA
jgi:hypothetical protein